MRAGEFQGVSCLLDSDIVIDYLRGHEYAEELLDRWSRQGLLAVSTLTHLEIYLGMRPAEEQETQAFLDGLTSMPVDVSIARKAGTLLGHLRLKGITVGIVDAIIGATALALAVPLLTNNTEHYPFPGLRVIKGREE